MRPLLPVQVTPGLIDAVTSLVERLSAHGNVITIADTGWSDFAEAAGLPPPESDSSASRSGTVSVAVGPVALALDALQDASPVGAIGFVAPAAIRRRWWQREKTEFLDPTFDLWNAGWTPIAVERVDVAGESSLIEVVIGNARPTPPAASALDDSN